MIWETDAMSERIIYLTCPGHTPGAFTWLVTDYGIEQANGDYNIEASRLTQRTERDGVEYYDWPVHLANKGTRKFDLEAVLTAWLVALTVHRDKYGQKLDHKMLVRSLTFARQIRRGQEI